MQYLPIKEFVELGFLQEVNRQFFHPLGLALEVAINMETGERTLSGIQDYREDPEGMVFSDLSDGEATLRATAVATLQRTKAAHRSASLGWVMQPIGNKR